MSQVYVPVHVNLLCRIITHLLRIQQSWCDPIDLLSVPDSSLCYFWYPFLTLIQILCRSYGVEVFSPRGFSIIWVLNGMDFFQAIHTRKSGRWITDKLQFLKRQIKIWICAWMENFTESLSFALYTMKFCQWLLNNDSLSSNNEVIVLSSGKNYLFQVLQAILNSMPLSYWKAVTAKLRWNNWSSSLPHTEWNINLHVSCFSCPLCKHMKSQRRG